MLAVLVKDAFETTWQKQTSAAHRTRNISDHKIVFTKLRLENAAGPGHGGARL